MRGIALIALVLVSATVIAAKPQRYTTKYDNVDLDEILKNKRLLRNYINCLLSKGNCTPDGVELKKVLPDAIASDCAKCSETQRNGSRKVLRHLLQHEKDSWLQLEKIYDPTGTYKKRHCADVSDDILLSGC